MDSLRLPKGSGGKSPSGSGGGGITIGMRFNAGEEIIEDIIKAPSETQQQQTLQQNQSLLNSPLQNIEDFNWRKEILQGGFFNRKRSGSIEGNKSGLLSSSTTSSSIINNTQSSSINQTIPSVNTNIIEAGSSNSNSSGSNNLANNLNNNSDNTSSVGTWKLIKGKVSQAMEDIKSSKSSNSSQQQKEQKELACNEDSDGGETASTNSNSENISTTSNLDIINNTLVTAPTSIGYNLPSLKSQHKYFSFSRRSNKSDTDSDDENETPSVVEDLIESSSLRKSFASLRTKAKTHLAGNSGGGGVGGGGNIGGTSTSTSTSSSSSSSSSTNILSSIANKKDTSIDNLTTKILTTTSAASAITSIATSITTPISSSSTTSLSLGSGIRSTFLRKRNKKQSPERSSPSSSTTLTTISSSTTSEQQPIAFTKKTKKEFEIESGVEMFEDMELQNVMTNDTMNSGMDLIKDTQEEGLKISLSTDTITYKKTSHILYHQQTMPNLLLTNKSDDKQKQIFDTPISRAAKENIIKNLKNNDININYIKKFQNHIQSIVLKIITNSNFLMTGILFIILIAAPIAEFFRGIIACLCIITFFNTFSEYFWNILNEKFKTVSVNYFGSGSNIDNNSLSMIGPQRCKFEIPDYSKMSICEIPPIEEYKSLKVYSGWLNEVNNYDPNNFHQSMARSVYIRLDGSILRILNTSTRIAKRSMWNESPIDRKNIIFTCSRTFNLIGARIEMLPRGLARKRYFSRKYPLQLIIKNYENEKSFPNDESTNLSSVDNITPLDGTDNLNKFERVDLIEDNQDINISTQNSKIPLTKTISDTNRNVTHQSSNESNDESRNNIPYDNQINDLDFGATVLSSDLQKLQDTQDPIALKETLPCGDETRILLFARCDREKEDWYRRFYSASIGAIHDQDLKIPDIVMITDEEVTQALKATSMDLSNEISNQNNDTSSKSKDSKDSKDDKDNKQQQQLPNQNSSNNTTNATNISNNDNSVPIEEASVFEGLLLSADAGRNPPEYIKFMARYQKACTQNKLPVVKSSLIPSETPTKRNRRQKRQEDELWKGINQSLYLGPSGSIVWANVLIGRVLFSCLNDSILLEKIQDFLQRKLSAIKLPSFMEDVSIAHINLGDTPPLIHRISQPQLDERGTWVDADVTYEGLVHMTITTKLNLLRLKRSQHGGGGSGGGTSGTSSGINTSNNTHNQTSSGNLSNTSAAIINSKSSSEKNDRNAPTDRTPTSNNITSTNGGTCTSSTTPTANNSSNTNISLNVAFGGGNGGGGGGSSSSNIGLTNSYVNIPGGISNSSTTTTVIDNNGKTNLTTTSTSSSIAANIDNLNLNENENATLIANLTNTNLNSDYNSQTSLVINSAIYDSNAESSGASSSESESPTTGSTLDIASESQAFHPSPGSSRRFLRIVDRITASNIFQSATEISYIQRAMENMSTKITLRVELKGLVSRVVVNIPPPPSDRIWLAFRGPPRLWISAKPAVGDHSFDWSVVTNVIENKLCDEVYKYLVYPNMVDIIVPFLGQSTYRD